MGGVSLSIQEHCVCLHLQGGLPGGELHPPDVPAQLPARGVPLHPGALSVPVTWAGRGHSVTSQFGVGSLGVVRGMMMMMRKKMMKLLLRMKLLMITKMVMSLKMKTM